ncbi:MAG: MFS transporter [Dysgonamonadaceae bacterium]|jgi:predicted MFS family arabinose efflux permease|nr:MFS transporter [Dysgonamonadaceae bacterium]
MKQSLNSSLKDRKNIRWTVLVLVSFTMLCAYYLTDALAPLELRLETSLSWSATDYGFYTGAYGWFNIFLLMLVFGGMILDKAGVKFTGILAIVIMLAGAGIKYWAISGHVASEMFTFKIGQWTGFEVKQSALVAGLGFAVFGVGAEMFGITANKAVIRWFKGRELALAIGLNTSVGRIGTALAMFTPVPLVSMTKNLSTPVILSVLLLCIGLITFICFSFLDKKLDKDEIENQEEKEEFKFSDIREIAKIKAFWIITVLCVLFYSAVFPFIKYATQLIVQKFGVSDEFAGNIPALLPFGALILTPVFGSLYDKKGKGATIMIIGSVLLLLVHLLFAVPSLNNLFIAIGLVLILGVAFSLVPSAMWPSVAKIIPEKRLGTAYSITFWVQNWGLMLVPMLIGYVLDKYCITGKEIRMIDGIEKEITLYSFTVPMLIFACFGALAIIFAFWLKKEDAKKGYGLEKANIDETGTLCEMGG